MKAPRIVPESVASEKLFTILFALMAARIAVLVLVALTAFLVLITAFFIVIDALAEVSRAVASTWASTDSITHLVIFGLACLFIYKVSPHVARLINARGTLL